MYLSADMAFSIGLLAGWLALVVWLVWPDPHCACCAKAPLHESAPEQLLGRADDRRKARGDLGLRPQRAQRVDVTDLLRSAGHDRARRAIADLEDRVETCRRYESKHDVALAEPHAAQVGL